MRIGMPSRTASALFVLALAACRHVEELPGPPERGPAGIPAMAREIQAAKSAETDAARLEAAIREIQRRYGYAVPESPEAAGMEPAVAGEENPSLGAGPLGKSAAYTKVWLTVKSFDFGNSLAFRRVFIVPPGKSITAQADPVDNSDPMLAAFSPSGQSPGATAYRTLVRVFNDDRDSGILSARITWKNNAGSEREFHVMAFAQNAATTGMANITVYPPGDAPLQLYNVPIIATPVYTNASTRPIGGCTNLDSSRIQLTWREGGGNFSGILAVNNDTKTGGIIMENGQTTQTLELKDRLTVGNWNFLMGFMLFRPQVTGTRFTGIQQNLYSCLLP